MSVRNSLTQTTMETLKPTLLDRIQGNFIEFIKTENISISTEPDGMGYYYGQVKSKGDVYYSINILPAVIKNKDNGYTEEDVLEVYAGGMSIATCRSIEEVNQTLLDLADDKIDVDALFEATEPSTEIH
jgi:hypothetical protein